MIDFITARLSFDYFNQEQLEKMRLLTDRIMRYNPVTGEQTYETSAWDSIRSDSHSITFRVGSNDLWLQGSPARCIGDGCNVFSSGASASHDIVESLARMVRILFAKIELTTDAVITDWEVSRIDITMNLALDSLAEVRQALAFLRNCEGGRYRVYQPDGDTVYWNKTSRYIKGKAYSKGSHLRYLMKKYKDYSGKEYSEEELNLTDKLLRLEVSIFSMYMKKHLKKKWYQLKANDLKAEWNKYFNPLMGHTIMNDEELKQRIAKVSPTDGQARSAYSAWYLIKSMGWELAKSNIPKSTWYRNLKILKSAGLKVADIGNGEIIQFHVKKLVVGHEVNTWHDLRQVA